MVDMSEVESYAQIGNTHDLHLTRTTKCQSKSWCYVCCKNTVDATIEPMRLSPSKCSIVDLCFWSTILMEQKIFEMWRTLENGE